MNWFKKIINENKHSSEEYKNYKKGKKIFIFISEIFMKKEANLFYKFIINGCILRKIYPICFARINHIAKL